MHDGSVEFRPPDGGDGEQNHSVTTGPDHWQATNTKRGIHVVEGLGYKYIFINNNTLGQNLVNIEHQPSINLNKSPLLSRRAVVVVGKYHLGLK